MTSVTAITCDNQTCSPLFSDEWGKRKALVIQSPHPPGDKTSACKPKSLYTRFILNPQSFAKAIVIILIILKEDILVSIFKVFIITFPSFHFIKKKTKCFFTDLK